MLGGLQEAIGALNWTAADRTGRLDQPAAEQGTIVRY
jgi:hypothetical protein